MNTNIMTDTLAITMKEAAQRLEELVNLEDDWDGYGSKPVKSANANFALKILKQICELDTLTPQIVPGCNGDLQIEWHTHAGSIELHVIEPGKVHYWTSNPDAGPDGGIYLANDFTQVKIHLRYIAQQSFVFGDIKCLKTNRKPNTSES